MKKLLLSKWWALVAFFIVTAVYALPIKERAGEVIDFFIGGVKQVEISEVGTSFSNTISAPDAVFSGTGALKIPSGTTAERPPGTAGLMRYNSIEDAFEGYGGGSWGPLVTDSSTATNTTVGLSRDLTESGYNELTFTNGGTGNCLTTTATQTVCFDSSVFSLNAKLTPYLTSSGTWKVKYQVQLNTSSIAAVAMYFSGITFNPQHVGVSMCSNSSNGGTAVKSVSLIKLNTNLVYSVCDTGNSFHYFYGDAPLTAKPLWLP